MIVMKFGGTSVANFEAITRTIFIIAGKLDQKPVVVVSALSKITDLLYAISDAASANDVATTTELLGQLRKRHVDLTEELLAQSMLKDEAVEFRGPAPVVDPVTYQTTVDDIFVGGDMYTGPRFAIDAIAAGKEAAVSLHRFVQPGCTLTIGRDPNYYKELDKEDISINDYDHVGRQKAVKNDSIGKDSFRSATGIFTEEQVKKETARCLGCGATIVDPNQCIGCGVCTTKCEFDAIHLERDLPKASVMRKSEDKLKYVLPNGLKQAIKIKLKGKK